jgi:periplasmic mercuric ion binding protein
MKIIHFITACVLMCFSISLSAQNVKKESVKVWGNCSSCKKHIEKAALENGATSAQWNITTKMLMISYNPSKTSEESIQKAIAAAGYDTEKYKGDDKAYTALDECCQYDRKPSPPTK